jgi:GlpG protein
LRSIGTAPSEPIARAFEDHLASLGISAKVVAGKTGWAIWVRDEDRVAQAEGELAVYLADPAAEKYKASRELARAVREAEAKREKLAAKHDRSMASEWSAPIWRRLPGVTLLIFISVIVALATSIGSDTSSPVLRALLFSEFKLVWIPTADGPRPEVGFDGLESIERGQIWRLFTPMFIHYGPFHLFCNMSALRYFGGKIEYQKRWRKFLLLAFSAALVSNLAEYYYEVWAGAQGAFGGMSGVGYALFGYVWMKGAARSEERMGVSPQNVLIMMAWFVLCTTGNLGPIANAAHGAGLFYGFIIGATRF